MTISHYLQFFFFPWNIAIYTLLDVLLTHISQLFYLKIPIIKNFSAGILNVLILFVLVWPTIDIQIVDLQRRSLGWYDSWPQHIYILLSRYCCPSFMEVYMFAILWISLGTSHHLIQGLDAAPSVWSSSEILKYQTHILPFLFIQVSSVYTKPILFFQVQFLAFCCNNLLDKIQSHPSLPGFTSTVWRQLSLFIDTKSLFQFRRHSWIAKPGEILWSCLRRTECFLYNPSICNQEPRPSRPSRPSRAKIWFSLYSRVAPASAVEEIV